MAAAVVILHGWGSRIERWRPLKNELEAAGLTVFLPKLPGFGEAKPPEEAWSVSDYVDWLKPQLPQEYFLAGHSFGGRLAIKLAAQNPKSLKGLILINSAGIKPKNYFKRAFFWALAKIGKGLVAIPPFSLLAGIGRKGLYKLAGSRDYAQAEAVMRETFKKVISQDLRGFLKKIRTPTLILWGREDKETPLGDGQLINRLIPNSKLIVFPQADHYLPLKAPQTVAGAITQFIKQVK